MKNILWHVSRKPLKGFALIFTLLFLASCSFQATKTSLNQQTNDGPAEGGPSTPSGPNTVNAEITSSLAPINNFNKSAYPISGTCSNTNSITIVFNEGEFSRDLACSNQIWSAVLDLNAVSLGNVTIQILSTGSSTPISSASAIKDVTPPSIGGALVDGTYSGLSTQSPSLSWSAATDSHSGLKKYQIALGSTSGGTQVLDWTDIGTVTSYTVTGLTLSDATTYYPSLRAVDNADNVSATITGDGWTVDISAPHVAALTLNDGGDDYEEWSTTKTPLLSWNAATDAVSGLSHYEISLGTSSGGNNVLNWSSVGNNLSHTFSGLNLSRGTTYYANLRAIDNVGNMSATVLGNGWTVNYELPAGNWTIRTMSKIGKDVYLGGKFSRLGPATGSVLPLNATTGQPSWPNPNSPLKIAGNMKVVIPDSSGGYYVGGYFTIAGASPKNNIAHVLADGTLDTNFSPNVSGSILTMALSGNDLFIGGSFTSIDGTTRNRIAKLNATSGVLDVTFNPDANNTVNALFESGGFLYMGGNFTTVSASTRNRIAKVDVTSGALDGTFNPNANNAVNALFESGGFLYMGGNFTTVSGSTRNAMAKVNATSGALDATFNPNVSGSVSSLVVQGSSVYLAGGIYSVGGTTQYSIAKVSTANGTLDTSFNPSPGDSINSISISGSNLYVAGTFNSIGAIARSYLAKYDVSAGIIDPSFNPNINSYVHALVVHGGFVYIGGEFWQVNSTARNRVAKINATTGALDASFNPNASSYVYALAVSGSSVYIGGQFTTLAGSTRNRIAKVNATNGALDASYNPNANGTVRAIAVSEDGNSVYVGGDFTNISSTAVNYLAKTNASNGAFVGAFVPNPDGSVSALSAAHGTLYVGGGFTTIGSSSANYLAKLDTTSGSRDVNFNPVIDDYSFFINSASSSSLYLGGGFSTVNGVSLEEMCKMDPTGNLDSAFNAQIFHYVTM